MIPEAGKLVGEHENFVRVVREAEQLAQISRPVLIRGERGTGKELFARRLHECSSRSDGPFVTLDCGAIGHELLWSEPFGHEKGAFTGAMQMRQGKLELADGGTLFLDEIGNMAKELQEKLLRVIEYQQFERAGGDRTLHVDLRIVATANADLELMIRENRFMAGLYDRLSCTVLRVPPLRERRSDIPLLIQHFTRALAEEMPNMEKRRFSQATVEKLCAYCWPGNVRQLKNVVEYMYIMNHTGTLEIQPDELPAEITDTALIGDTFDEQLESFERTLLRGALRETGSNQKRAAEKLGLTYDRFRHLYRKIVVRDRV